MDSKTQVKNLYIIENQQTNEPNPNNITSQQSTNITQIKAEKNSSNQQINDENECQNASNIQHYQISISDENTSIQLSQNFITSISETNENISNLNNSIHENSSQISNDNDTDLNQVQNNEKIDEKQKQKQLQKSDTYSTQKKEKYYQDQNEFDFEQFSQNNNSNKNIKNFETDDFGDFDDFQEQQNSEKNINQGNLQQKNIYDGQHKSKIQQINYDSSLSIKNNVLNKSNSTENNMTQEIEIEKKQIKLENILQNDKQNQNKQNGDEIHKKQEEEKNNDNQDDDDFGDFQETNQYEDQKVNQNIKLNELKQNIQVENINQNTQNVKENQNSHNTDSLSLLDLKEDLQAYLKNIGRKTQETYINNQNSNFYHNNQEQVKENKIIGILNLPKVKGLLEQSLLIKKQAPQKFQQNITGNETQKKLVKYYNEYKHMIRQKQNIGLKFDTYTLISYAKNIISTTDQWNESLNKKKLLKNLDMDEIYEQIQEESSILSPQNHSMNDVNFSSNNSNSKENQICENNTNLSQKLISNKIIDQQQNQNDYFTRPIKYQQSPKQNQIQQYNISINNKQDEGNNNYQNNKNLNPNRLFSPQKVYKSKIDSYKQCQEHLNQLNSEEQMYQFQQMQSYNFSKMIKFQINNKTKKKQYRSKSPAPMMKKFYQGISSQNISNIKN